MLSENYFQFTNGRSKYEYKNLVFVALFSSIMGVLGLIPPLLFLLHQFQLHYNHLVLCLLVDC